MAKRKPKETVPAVDAITVESQGNVEALEQTVATVETTATEQLVVSTIGDAIQKLGVFKNEEYDITTETSNIVEAAMRLHGQGKTTADHMANMIDMLETNRETSSEEKIAAYGKLLHDTLVAISKLGYDPVAVFNEYVEVKESIQKKRPVKADYSKAKVN